MKLTEEKGVELLNKSLEAWKIMAEVMSETLLYAKNEDGSDNKEIHEAIQHAENSFSQEINGFRDHIKVYLTETTGKNYL